MSYTSIEVKTEGAIAHIVLNRPERANALDATMWRELAEAFEWLDESKARVGILSGAGEHFSAGIDFDFLHAVQQHVAELPASYREPSLEALIRDLQAATAAPERCSKPVIAAIHGACIGGGLALALACDLRYTATSARFSVKEVDLAIVADLGTLQRLPRLVGQGLARELAFTAREFNGDSAVRKHLVNASLPDRVSMMQYAMKTARTIAAKSPATIRGIKESFNYGIDHTVAESLDHIARHNARSLFSSDLFEALAARREKREPKFED